MRRQGSEATRRANTEPRPAKVGSRVSNSGRARINDGTAPRVGKRTGDGGNSSSRREYHQEWYRKNKERVLAVGLAWRQANRDKVRVINQRWRAAHPERMRAAKRRWCAENPAAVKAAKMRHRARKAAAPINDFTAGDWRALCVEFNHCCAYCGADKPLTQDHILALTAGGAHTKANIVPACASCNARKRTRDVTEFVECAA